MFEKVDVLEVVILKNIKGDVVLKNVYFGYCLEKIILKGVFLYVLVGKKIVLVGVIGVGKIMILNLFFCFFDI